MYMISFVDYHSGICSHTILILMATYIQIHVSWPAVAVVTVLSFSLYINRIDIASNCATTSTDHLTFQFWSTHAHMRPPSGGHMLTTILLIFVCRFQTNVFCVACCAHIDTSSIIWRWAMRCVSIRPPKRSVSKWPCGESVLEQHNALRKRISPMPWP